MTYKVNQEAQAAFDRGKEHYDNKDYDKAIKEFDDAISLDADNVSAYTSRGNAYRNKGQYD